MARREPGRVCVSVYSLLYNASTLSLELTFRAVVTFLFVNVGPSLDNWSDAYARTGFDRLSYVPPVSKRNGMALDDWPTVEAMVRSGKRAVTFLASGADETLVPYLLSEFQHMFEASILLRARRRWNG